MDKLLKRQLEDFMKVSRGELSKKEVLRKYKISNRTFVNYKKRFVTKYGIDPRLLYRDSSILNSEELLSYIKDKPKNINSSNSNDIINNDKEVKEVINTNIDNNPFLIKGKSTLYDEEGNVKLTWIKESLDQEVYYDGLKKAIKELTEGVKPVEAISVPKHTKENLMTFIPIPDLHLGMYIDGKEVSHGKDWNLEIAENQYYKSMYYLIENSPASKECVIFDTGDITHSENDNNRTARSGHALSTSDRYSKTILTLFKILINTITKALEKFEIVYFYSVPGNHNDNISLVLKCVLANHFANNHRVKIDVDKYCNVTYHKFGKNLIGMSHGHTTKPEKSLEVMTYDNLSTLSNYNNFDFYFGHFHQEKSFQIGMINVHLLKPLIPQEAWADSMGYRGEFGYSKAIIYDKEYGQVSTITHKYGMTANKK